MNKKLITMISALFFMISSLSTQCTGKENESENNESGEISQTIEQNDSIKNIVVNQNSSSEDITPKTMQCRIIEVGAEPIVNELSATDTISSGKYSDCYTITNIPAEGLRIHLFSRDFDTYLVAEFEDGKNITNDDYNGTAESLINISDDFLAERNDESITIKVTSYEAGETGRYSLEVESAIQGRTDIAANLKNISYSAEVNYFLNIGDVIENNLSNSDEQLDDGRSYDEYYLYLDQGEMVSIELASDMIDPYLMLYNSDGLITENDDFNPDTTDSKIFYTSSRTEEIRIIATSYDRDEFGQYSLSISRNLPEISSGDRINGSLTEDDNTLTGEEYMDSYSVFLRAGSTLIADMVSSDFDTYIILKHPSGYQEDFDDHFVGQDRNSNAHVESFISETGNYTLIATSYEARETGNYTLSLNVESSIAFKSVNDIVANIGTLESTDSVLETGEYFDSYTFYGNAGQLVSIEAISDEFDTYLILFYPDGEQIDNDDISDNDYNSMIETRLPSTGEYEIYITSYEPGEMGDYEIWYPVNQDQYQDDSYYTEQDYTSAAIQSFTGRLEAGDEVMESGEYVDTYYLSGIEGQQIDITLESDDFDTYVILSFPSEEQEDNDDIIEGNSNSGLQMTLPETGEYEIWVTSYEADETGRYNLSYSFSGSDTTYEQGSEESTRLTGEYNIPHRIRGDLASTDLTDYNGEFVDRYEISVKAGDRLNIDLSSSEFDAYLLFIDPSGEILENDDNDFDGRSTTDSHLEVEASSDGVAVIDVTSYEVNEIGQYTMAWTIIPGSTHEIVVDTDDGENEGNQAGSSEAIPGRQYYGIFVGISDYQSYSDLHLCDSDADKLAQAFIDRGIMNKYYLLMNDSATKEKIETAFEEIARHVDENDVFIFFYSGHGDQDSNPNPSVDEADQKDEYIVTYTGALISDDEMAAYFDTINAGISIIALDSCFSGGFAKDVISRPGRMGMFSSEEDLTSAVPNEFNAGGYLSYYLMQGILGEADSDPRDRIITAGELSHYLILQFGQNVSDSVRSENIDGVSRAGYQHLVIDRGGVTIDTELLRL